MKRDILFYIILFSNVITCIFKIRICVFTITCIRRIICFNRDSFNKMCLILDNEMKCLNLLSILIFHKHVYIQKRIQELIKNHVNICYPSFLYFLKLRSNISYNIFSLADSYVRFKMLILNFIFSVMMVFKEGVASAEIDKL